MDSQRDIYLCSENKSTVVKINKKINLVIGFSICKRASKRSVTYTKIYGNVFVMYTWSNVAEVIIQ